MAPKTPKSSPGSALKSSNTVPELRSICSDYGLDTDGRKAELVERIKEHEATTSAKAKTPRSRTPAAVRRLQSDSGHEDLSHMDENGDGRVMRSEAKKYREKAAEREPPQTVSALKAKLTEMGLSTKGVKSELMARLNDALDKLSGAAGSPAGKGEESEMGEVFANDSTEEANFVPVFMGFAAVLACIAWHLQNIGQA